MWIEANNKGPSKIPKASTLERSQKVEKKIETRELTNKEVAGGVTASAEGACARYSMFPSSSPSTPDSSSSSSSPSSFSSSNDPGDDSSPGGTSSASSSMRLSGCGGRSGSS